MTYTADASSSAQDNERAAIALREFWPPRVPAHGAYRGAGIVASKSPTGRTPPVISERRPVARHMPVGPTTRAPDSRTGSRRRDTRRRAQREPDVPPIHTPPPPQGHRHPHDAATAKACGCRASHGRAQGMAAGGLEAGELALPMARVRCSWGSRWRSSLRRSYRGTEGRRPGARPRERAGALRQAPWPQDREGSIRTNGAMIAGEAAACAVRAELGRGGQKSTRLGPFNRMWVHAQVFSQWVVLRGAKSREVSHGRKG